MDHHSRRKLPLRGRSPMRCVMLFVGLSLGALLAAHAQEPVPKPDPPASETAKPDESTVKAAGRPTRGEGRVDGCENRSQRSAEAGPSKELITQLGDKDAAKRDKAFGGLVQHGRLAVPLLRQAAANVDEITVSTQARACLK